MTEIIAPIYYHDMISLAYLLDLGSTMNIETIKEISFGWVQLFCGRMCALRINLGASINRSALIDDAAFIESLCREGV